MNVDVTVRWLGGSSDQLDRIEALLRTVLTNMEKLRMTEQEVLGLIKEVDAATTAIANNVDALSVTEAKNGVMLQTISDEVDALLKVADVPAAVSDALQSLKGRLDTARAASDTVKAGLDAQVPVLEAIASKGAARPVPLPVPPPPQP